VDTEACIKVDEHTWHPIFSKEKWFDFQERIIDEAYFPEGVEGLIQRMYGVSMSSVSGRNSEFRWRRRIAGWISWPPKTTFG